MAEVDATGPQKQQRQRRSTLEGGYDIELVEKLAEEIEVDCPICKLILRDPYHPVTCECGAHFCKSCIKPIYDEKGPCPVCKANFDTIAPNIEKKRFLEGKKVYCTYKRKGCTWTGELKILDSHLKDVTTTGCQYCEETCPLCAEKIPRGLLTSHGSSICPKRPYHCEYCNDYQSDYMDVTYNHMPKCSLAPMQCPNGGCIAKPMPRKDLGKHLLECPEEVVRCKLASAGCGTRFLRKESEKHYQESVCSHVELLVEQGNSERCNLNGKMKSLENENRKMQEEVKRMMEAVDYLKSESSRPENESNNTIKELKLEISSLKGEVKTLSQKLAEKDAASMQISRHVDTTREELSLVQATVRKNALRIQQVSSQTEQEGVMRVDDVQKELQQVCGPLRYQVNQNTKDIKSVADDTTRNIRRVSEHVDAVEYEIECAATKTNSCFNEVDKKFEDLEDQALVTLSSDLGKQPVVITLRDYAYWQVENKEWNSPPFYLDGYKLCLTAFVNGDPQQNAQGFFSLYVHLMKGENDHRLNWPFQHSVILELLHKEDEKKNVKEMLPFDNNLDKKYNGRVKGPEERAKGWGYAKFMPHERLNMFLRGPREFLYIRVSLKSR